MMHTHHAFALQEELRKASVERAVVLQRDFYALSRCVGWMPRVPDWRERWVGACKKLKNQWEQVKDAIGNSEVKDEPMDAVDKAASVLLLRDLVLDALQVCNCSPLGLTGCALVG